MWEAQEGDAPRWYCRPNQGRVQPRRGGDEAGAMQMDEGTDAADDGLAAAHQRRRGSAPVASYWMAAKGVAPAAPPS